MIHGILGQKYYKIMIYANKHVSTLVLLLLVQPINVVSPRLREILSAILNDVIWWLKIVSSLSLTNYLSDTLSLLMAQHLEVPGYAQVLRRLSSDPGAVVIYSIMMLMKFSDLSQSDHSNWVMWQVKDPCPGPGWDKYLTREKMAFIKSIKTWIILLYIWFHL